MKVRHNQILYVSYIHMNRAFGRMERLVVRPCLHAQKLDIGNQCNVINKRLQEIEGHDIC